MINPFTAHPRHVNESYFTHFKWAAYFSIQLLLASFACIIHAIFPFCFQKTGSEIILKLVNYLITRMPVVDERYMIISRSIEKKLSENSHLSL